MAIREVVCNNDSGNAWHLTVCCRLVWGVDIDPAGFGAIPGNPLSTEVSMKQISLTGAALLCLIFILFLAETSHGWWSGKQNSHYHLITLSEQKLSSSGLYNPDILKDAASCPDGPHKNLLEHDKIVRVKENFCATVAASLSPPKFAPVNCAGDCQSTADCMGRTLHYLDDKADVTETDHKEDLRRHVYERFGIIKQHPLLSRNLQHYASRLFSPDTDTLAQRMFSERGPLIDDMRKANSPIETRAAARDAVFAKTFALVQAGQDRLIDLYHMERNKYASDICRDMPAYCVGLEKQIDQACQTKDLAAVKRLIDAARHAKAESHPSCRKLHANEKRYVQQCGGGPVSIGLRCPQGCNVTSGGGRKDFTLTVTGDVQFPLTFTSRLIGAPQCGTSWRQGDEHLTQNMMTQTGGGWQHTFKNAIFCNVGSNRPECQSFTYTYQYWVVTADKRKSNVVQHSFTCTAKPSQGPMHSPCAPGYEPITVCQASDNRNIDCCSPPPACAPNPKCIKVTCTAKQRCVQRFRR